MNCGSFTLREEDNLEQTVFLDSHCMRTESNVRVTSRSNEDFVCHKATTAIELFPSEVFLCNPSSLISNPHCVSLKVGVLSFLFFSK